MNAVVFSITQAYPEFPRGCLADSQNYGSSGFRENYVTNYYKVKGMYLSLKQPNLAFLSRI